MYRQTIGSQKPQDVGSRKDYWKIRDAYIERLNELVGPAEIVIVVRRQVDFAESMYQEHVKVTRYTKTFKSFLSEYWFHFDYLQQVHAWERVFGKIRVIPFEDIKGPEICTRFLNRLNLVPGPLNGVGKMNVGLPHDAVILKRGLNGQSYTRDKLNTFAALMSNPSFDPDPPRTRRSFFASADERAAFQNRFAEANDKLSLKIDPRRKPLFEPLDDTRLYGDFLKPERAELLAARLAVPVRTDDRVVESLPVDFHCDLPNHRLYYTRLGRTLIVAFDNAGAPHREPEDRLPWGHKFFSGEGHSVLGVVAKSSDWFRDADLRGELRRLKATGFFEAFDRVVMTGSSMGGFGATTFASLAPGCRVIAYNPQSTLRADRVPWESQHEFGRSQDWTGSFSDAVEGAAAAETVYIFYDPYVAADRLHAERYTSPNIRLFRAPFMGHGLPDTFLELGLLKTLMRLCINANLEDAWFYRAIRTRRTLKKYRTEILAALARTAHPKLGLATARWASLDTLEPQFRHYEALFNAALGDLPRAQEIFEEIAFVRRRERRRRRTKPQR